ncbi:MAG: peptidase [Bacillota bacterium]
MRLIFIFVDGIGLGRPGNDNPFVFSETAGLSDLLEGEHLTKEKKGFIGSKATLLGVDATLGISGLPQSATGQTALFTGINAAYYLGNHLRGFPNGPLRNIIAEHSIFRQLKKMGCQVAFINAYRPPFFDLLKHGLPGNRYSCSTLITYYGGLRFQGIEDIKSGKALYMDITNEVLQRLGFAVTMISPEKGAKRLIQISRDYDFCLFEYFLSDLAGHLGDRNEARRVISILDRFIGRVAELINQDEEMILISSDHGNLEDLSSRNHTYNEVPVLLVGDHNARNKFNHINSLVDILPGIKEVLNY